MISYHQNADPFAVLGTSAGIYRWHDLEDFDHPLVVGTTIGEVVDFFWRQADALLAPAQLSSQSP